MHILKDQTKMGISCFHISSPKHGMKITQNFQAYRRKESSLCMWQKLESEKKASEGGKILGFSH